MHDNGLRAWGSRKWHNLVAACISERAALEIVRADLEAFGLDCINDLALGQRDGDSFVTSIAEAADLARRALGAAATV